MLIIKFWWAGVMIPSDTNKVSLEELGTLNSITHS